MKRFESAAVWGILLVVVGTLALLQSLGLMSGLAQVIWAVPFAIVGVGFLVALATDRTRWWAAIPGLSLLGVALVIIWDNIMPMPAKDIGGPLFLVMLSASFWLVYLLERKNWWAVIPGGVLLSAAVVAGIDALASGVDSGPVMLLGLAATFAVLSFIRTPQGRLRWPVVPAIVLAVVGLAVAAGSSTWLGYIWPVALIVGGGLIIFRTMARGKKE